MICYAYDLVNILLKQFVTFSLIANSISVITKIALYKYFDFNTSEHSCVYFEITMIKDFKFLISKRLLVIVFAQLAFTIFCPDVQ